MISARAFGSKREKSNWRSSSSVMGFSLHMKRTFSGAFISAEGKSPNISKTTARLLSSFFLYSSSRSSSFLPLSSPSSSSNTACASIRANTTSSSGFVHSGDAILTHGAPSPSSSEGSGGARCTPRCFNTSFKSAGSSYGSCNISARIIRTSTYGRPDASQYMLFICSNIPFGSSTTLPKDANVCSCSSSSFVEEEINPFNALLSPSPSMVIKN
mmetsp:Transcript_29160/g.44091  ORF Transcript_29160/g.44091 Transcript_29160/m.44091 type:complete len:214 (+) Transcript_29160:225-866(+)